MITGAILSFIASVVSTALSVIPQIPVPSWVSGAGDAIGKVLAFADSMSPWFPTNYALMVGGALLLIKLSGFGIKVVRIVISHVTGGGGSAA